MAETVTVKVSDQWDLDKGAEIVVEWSESGDAVEKGDLIALVYVQWPKKDEIEYSVLEIRAPVAGQLFNIASPGDETDVIAEIETSEEEKECEEE